MTTLHQFTKIEPPTTKTTKPEESKVLKLNNSVCKENNHKEQIVLKKGLS